MDLRPLPVWRALYLAALFEKDEERMAQRIAETKKALRARAHELFRTRGDTLPEESAIDEAFQALHALEQSAGSSVRSAVLSDGDDFANQQRLNTFG